MFQTKVSKDVLLSKIKEEISRLEDEWDEDLYKENQTKINRTIDSIRFAQSIFNSPSNLCWSIDLELEETVYKNINDEVYEKSKLRAVKRKDRLLNISGIINLTEENYVDIDEDTYSFIFKEFDCKKFTYPPFKETERYSELLRRKEAQRVGISQNTSRPVEACGSDNITTGSVSHNNTRPLEPRVISDGVDVQVLKVLVFLLVVCIFVAGLLYVLN